MPEQIHRLFFALHPDPLVAGEIGRAVAAIQAGGCVRGRWVKPPKRHMTVQFLGTHDARPERVVEQARLAAAQVRLAPFDVVLDRVETFGGHRRSPCVLRCTPDTDAAVRTLHSALGKALAMAGLAQLLEGRFAPHVTIAYVDGSLAKPIAIPPITWPVREFSLVESRGAETSHEVLDRWSLSR